MNKENCTLKFVDEIILYYDARSKKHQKAGVCQFIHQTGNFTISQLFSLWQTWNEICAGILLNRKEQKIRESTCTNKMQLHFTFMRQILVTAHKHVSVCLHLSYNCQGHDFSCSSNAVSALKAITALTENCTSFFCHRVTTQLQLTNISCKFYKIWSCNNTFHGILSLFPERTPHLMQ